MTIADQITNIETKTNDIDAKLAALTTTGGTVGTPVTVDLTPVLNAIAADKAEQDTINANVAAILAKLTSTPTA